MRVACRDLLLTIQKQVLVRHSSRNSLIFCFIVIISILFNTLYSNIVLAAYGPGSQNISYLTNCGAQNAYTGLCDLGNGFIYGGASWRIFRLDTLNLKGKADGLDIYAGGLMTDTTQKATAITQCSNEGAKYVISYGYEGIRPEVSGNEWYNYQIGPGARKHPVYGWQVLGQASYNTYNAKSWGSIKSKYNNGTLSNNTKITKAAATILYRFWRYTIADDPNKKWEDFDDLTIPLTTGWFCGHPTTTNSSAHFYGIATVSNSDSSVTDTTGWSDDDDTASIDIPSGDSGVNATFKIRLRSNKNGNTDTAYYHWRNKLNSGKWSEFSDFKKKRVAAKKHKNYESGTSIISATKKVELGKKTCYQLNFGATGATNYSAVKLKACAKAKITTFTGFTLLKVAGVNEYWTNYGASNTTSNIHVTCTYSNPCKISFLHGLKTNYSKGSTKYFIQRYGSNNSISNKVLKGKSPLDSSNTKLNGPVQGGIVVYEGEQLTVYPGMKVCEKISFYNSNDPDDRDQVDRGICFYAEGNARDYSDAAFLNLTIKNENVNNYKEYRTNDVYAKPGDTISFNASYNPTLQWAYALYPDYMQINGGAIYTNNNNPKKSLGGMFNDKIGSLKWKNGFAVNSSSKIGTVNGTDVIGFNKNFLLKAGCKTFPTSDQNCIISSPTNPNTYKIDNSDVGLVLTESAYMNSNDSVKTTPTQVNFYYKSSSQFVSNVITNQTIGNSVNAKIPYNFTTDINIKLGCNSNSQNDQDKCLYPSGENGSATVNVSIKPKSNRYTTNSSSETYATKSNAKIKLVLYIPKNTATTEGIENYGNLNSSLCSRYNSSSCYEAFTEESIVLNQEGNKSGIKKDISGQNFNIPDLDAGTEVCVAAAVYPSTSGSDDNLSPNGSNTWNISKAQCFTVYKKPSIQVWGGDVFSAGPISTPLAKKRHIKGVNDPFNMTSTNIRAAFGSFTELGLMPLMAVDGFASGAATGFSGNNSGFLAPSETGSKSLINTPGGYSKEPNGGYSSFCELSRLTFGNAGASQNSSPKCNDSVPGLGGSSSSSVNTDITSLVSTFVNMSDDEATKKNIAVHRISGNYELQKEDISIENGQTKVIYTEGTTDSNYVTIRNNIEYPTGRYTDLSNIPKMIIFANNIRIDCNVTRIDAVLIAKGTVNTCVNSSGNTPDINDGARSKQLRINGSVIAGKLEANRTYGAATGSNSIVPAEIINYDTTLYLWGAKKADVTETGKLDTTYLRELAPKR